MAAKAVEFTSAFVERAQGGDETARDAILKKIQPIVRAFFIKRIACLTQRCPQRILPIGRIALPPWTLRRHCLH